MWPIGFGNLDKALDVFSTYEKLLMTGDINNQKVEECLDTSLYQPELKSYKPPVTGNNFFLTIIQVHKT